MKQYRKATKLESIVYQVIITLTLIALPVFGHAATTEQALPAEVTETAGDGDGFDWNKLIDAIAHFESKGNARAVNGQYVGLLQISPVLVRECNNILKARGESKRYTLKASETWSFGHALRTRRPPFRPQRGDNPVCYQ